VTLSRGLQDKAEEQKQKKQARATHTVLKAISHEKQSKNHNMVYRLTTKKTRK